MERPSMNHRANSKLTERFKVETGRMKGVPECMRISGFTHGVNNPELTKRLNEHVPKTMEEMITVTTAFIRGETVAASKKKDHAPWKPQDQPKSHVFERKFDFRGKFKPPPPMVTPVEKRSNNKFCDFHNNKGHNTDECIQLKKQIEELVRAGKLSHLIKEIKQGRDQMKVGKKESPTKDKSLTIYMVQPWHRMTRQKVTQSFTRVSEITFPPLTTTKGTEGLLVIEAEIGGHMIHHMYVDGGFSTEVIITVQWYHRTMMEYLKDGTLPDDRNEASKLRIKARQYKLLEGVLYRRSFLKPWLRCVGPLQADYVIREIHEGSCSMHAGPRSVVAKAMRLGYYWPIMHRDARDMIRTCNDCQIHHPVPRNPQQPLTLIMAPWPFYKWGINIAGPFPKGLGKVKFLIVAMDYFIKWIEAKAVVTITGNQSNRLVERANRSLGEGIKACLGEGNKNWIKELPHVLWAHRTMIKSSHGEIPFSLTYGTEVVIPTEIGMPTYRTTAVDAVHNDE
ncbi:reverse transcriptase domain-containing protein [Tanacetum coccineum]